MAVYKPHSKEGYYGSDYRDEEGNPKPETIRVTPRQLAVGDIVLISQYVPNSGYEYRSAAVSGIEKLPNPSYAKKWKITLIDSKGKVEDHNVGDGRIYQFERQCSTEVKENVEERGRNITLRRDVKRLEGKVEDLIRQMDWFKQNGGKNPKMPDYRDQVFSFYQSLGIMYDDVGNDLGLPPRAKKKKKK